MLKLEEELDTIERIVRRVEIANDKGQHYGPSGVAITPPSDLHSMYPNGRPLGSSSSGNSHLISYGGNGTPYGFTEAVNTPRADLMVDLIQQYTDLIANIERASSKQINVQVRELFFCLDTYAIYNMRLMCLCSSTLASIFSLVIYSRDI